MIGHRLPSHRVRLDPHVTRHSAWQQSRTYLRWEASVSNVEFRSCVDVARRRCKKGSQSRLDKPKVEADLSSFQVEAALERAARSPGLTLLRAIPYSPSGQNDSIRFLPRSRRDAAATCQNRKAMTTALISRELVVWFGAEFCTGNEHRCAGIFIANVGR